MLFHARHCQELKISYNVVYYSLHRTVQTGSNQNRKRSGRPQCRTEQEDKYIRVSSLRNRRLTSPQLAASLNSTCKTPVSTSTVKRQLRDAGLLGEVAKKKPYLRLAIKKIKMGKRTQTLDRGTLPSRPASKYSP
jgi:transposase